MVIFEFHDDLQARSKQSVGNRGRGNRWACRVLLAAGILLAPLAVEAQRNYPAKPIRIILPYGTGGGSDTVSRLLADKLTRNLGVSVVVENRPGASGIIGADFVAKSPPDGYTVLYDGTAHSVNPSLRKLPFETLKDLVPVALLVVNPIILVVPKSMPAKTVSDLVALAKSSPGKMSYASVGTGSLQHMAGELFKSAAKVDIVHVPYKGGGQVLPDLASGRVDMYFPNIVFGLSHVKAGGLHALAVMSEKRSASAPDVPTIVEAGYPGVVAHEWNGVFVPGGTPPEIIVRLNSEFNKALVDAEVKERLSAMGGEAAGGTPEQFTAYLREAMAKWDRVVKEAGIRVE